MKGKPIRYSDEELAWVEAHKALPRRELYARFQARFGRCDVTLDRLKSLCKRRGWFTGRTGCFPKGSVPANKGRKGYHPPGSEKGWFKPGVRRGVAVRLYKSIGTERVSKDGYLERKVNDDMPPQKRWRAVYRINWEQANGPVPEGHRLKCLDGDRTNTDPSNWEAIPFALAPRLNGRFGRGYDDAPAELKPTILATAKLEHALREAKKGAK